MYIILFANKKLLYPIVIILEISVFTVSTIFFYYHNILKKGANVSYEAIYSILLPLSFAILGHQNDLPLWSRVKLIMMRKFIRIILKCNFVVSDTTTYFWNSRSCLHFVVKFLSNSSSFFVYHRTVRSVLSSHSQLNCWSSTIFFFFFYRRSSIYDLPKSSSTSL